MHQGMPFDDLQLYGQAKAHEIQERRNRRKIEDEKASVDRKLKAFWAPTIWEQTREAIRQRVVAINAALGESVLQIDAADAGSMTIKIAKVTANLAASYDAANGRIVLSLDDHTENYDMDVVRGEVKLKAVGYFSPSQVAKMLVDKAATMVP